jgi:hypothetical protein
VFLLRRISAFVGVFFLLVWLMTQANLEQIAFQSKYDFNVNHDNSQYELTQDFDSLLFSTFIGGSGDDSCNSIAIDSNGDFYITGYTDSTDFPAIAGFDNTYSGGSDCFVMKLNSTGTGIIYSTFLGGSNAETGFSIAVDSSGCAYVTGITDSFDFPVQNSYQNELKGGHDCFITKLSENGDSLVYSTFIGGFYLDFGYSIFVDEEGNAYVTGETDSSDFPTVNSFDETFNGDHDSFLLKLGQQGNILEYSTFIGGSATDTARAVVVDSSGSAYISGETGSTDFPTLSAYDDIFNGGAYDCFVTKLSEDGQSLNYSTFIGGLDDDQAFALALDNEGQVFITGQTKSNNFPIVNPYDVDHSSWDCFVSKLSRGGDSLLYSTMIGGDSVDYARSISLNDSGSVLVAGYTSSTDFPCVNEFDSEIEGGTDGMFFELSASGNELECASYFGSSQNDFCRDLCTDSEGRVFLVGETSSVNFPLNNALEPVLEGDTSGFISSLTLTRPVTTTTSITPHDSTPPHDSTVNDTDSFVFGPVEVTIIAITVGAPIISLISYMRIKSKKKEEIVPLTTPSISTESIEVLRGAEFIGNRLRYKVKVANNSETIINDVTITIVSYPRDSLKLEGNTTKSIAKIEPAGFRSPSFEFLPTQDCVKGNIAAAVSFVDSKGKLHSINAEPYTVRAVCDLLQPEQITADEFETKVSELEHGDMTVKVIDWSPEEMYSKTLQVLESTNFSNVTTETQKLREYIEFKVKGWAKGKYTGKKIGIEVGITGKPGMKGATCRIVVSGEDNAMILPAIDEVSQKLSAWLCPKCGANLTPEQVSQLSQGKSIQCSFCGVSINR